MKKIRETQSGLLKGILMWIPVGLVVVVLLTYVIRELPQRYPNAMRVMANPSYISAAAGEAPADIKAARVAGSARNGGNSQPTPPVNRDNSPGANDNPNSAQATSAPSVRGRNTSPLANAGVAEAIPTFDLEMMGMVNELKSIDSDSVKAAQLRRMILDRLMAEFTANQESQRKELARLKKVIGEWEGNLLLREKMRREIIESQLASRLGIPNPLQWEYEGKNMLAPSLPLDVLSTSKTLMNAYWEHAARDSSVLAEVSERDPVNGQPEAHSSANAAEDVGAERKKVEVNSSPKDVEEPVLAEDPKEKSEPTGDGQSNKELPNQPTEESPKPKDGTGSDGSGDAE